MTVRKWEHGMVQGYQGSPWRLAWHQRSSSSMPFEYAVDGSTSQTHTGSNSILLNALTGKCKHLMPHTHRGLMGHCSNNQKNFWKICKYWFKVVTVFKLIWGTDHLYCGLGARRSHLTLHWMSAQGSVGFRWGTITGPYHANFSQVETQKFDPHWFYCLQWGCNNLFCQECIKVRSHCVRVRISLSIRFSFRVRRTIYTESEFLSVFDLISCPQLPRQTSKCDFV